MASIGNHMKFNVHKNLRELAALGQDRFRDFS